VGKLVSVQNQFSPRHPSSFDELHTGTLTVLPSYPAVRSVAPGAAPIASASGSMSSLRSRRHGVSPQQVVLASELALSEHVIPIPGARRAASIVDSARAVDLVFARGACRVLGAVGLELD
jgi:hypothetical protein